jgi:DNA-binding transcriptional LysR family regulator
MNAERRQRRRAPGTRAVLDTRRLRIFCTVADEGSFTVADARLHLTQSAIPQQMAILEREVGTALVERCPRGIRLTAAGRLLADRARLLLSEPACLEHDLHRLGERPASVHLGVFSTAGAYLIPLVVHVPPAPHRDTSGPAPLPARRARRRCRHRRARVGLRLRPPFAGLAAAPPPARRPDVRAAPGRPSASRSHRGAAAA